MMDFTHLRGFQRKWMWFRSVQRANVLTHAQLLTLFALIDRHNLKRNLCCPSMARIGDDIGMQERTARDAVRALENLDLISTTEGGGRRRSNRYKLSYRSPWPERSPAELGNPELPRQKTRSSSSEETLKETNLENLISAKKWDRSQRTENRVRRKNPPMPEDVFQRKLAAALPGDGWAHLLSSCNADELNDLYAQYAHLEITFSEALRRLEASLS